jgi:hypothetical protein
MLFWICYSDDDSLLIETAKVEAEACQRPYRDRRSALLGPLVIEVVAWFSVWVRLYGRWSTMRKFEADDWIMLVALVSLSAAVHPCVPD